MMTRPKPKLRRKRLPRWAVVVEGAEAVAEDEVVPGAEDDGRHRPRHKGVQARRHLRSAAPVVGAVFRVAAIRQSNMFFFFHPTGLAITVLLIEHSFMVTFPQPPAISY